MIFDFPDEQTLWGSTCAKLLSVRSSEASVLLEIQPGTRDAEGEFVAHPEIRDRAFSIPLDSEPGLPEAFGQFASLVARNAWRQIAERYPEMTVPEEWGEATEPEPEE